MSQVKVVSFDFWNTLAIPNPEYAKARNCHLEKYYGLERGRYSEVKGFLDNTALEYNKAWSTVEAWQMLFKNKKTKMEAKHISLEIEQLFFRHPPTILTEPIQEAFDILRQKGIKAVITSNTNFVSGLTIKQQLVKLGINRWFESTNFSDLVGLAKPDQNMFQFAISGLGVDVSEVMHIGDSFAFDIATPMMVGMRSAIVDPSTPHEHILGYVKGL